MTGARMTVCCSALALGMALGGCAAANAPPVTVTPENPIMSEPATPANAEHHITASGTVRFQQIEGGFWGIVGDDGRRYDPMELPPEFHKDGLRVRFEAVPETDMMSTRMWGTMITLTAIEALKPD